MIGTSFSVTRGNPVDTAEEDKTSQSRDNQAHDPAGDAECIGAGLGDGVGLHHAAHEAQSQNDGNGEEYCQEAAKLVVERLLDVEHGAAGNTAVLMDDPGLLRQHGFGIDGGHAKKAMIHIQKIAPGPPTRIAPQAPTMLPVPT